MTGDGVPIASFHHLALRVADVERSAAFYAAALGARLRTRPVRRAGAFVEQVLGGPPGVEQRGCLLELGGGVGIELVEVAAPAVPVEQDERWRRVVPHFCVRVDDVRAAAARVQALGGRELFPVSDATGQPFVYVADLDGHVIELVQMSLEQAVSTVHAFVPGSDPDGPTAG